METDPIPFRPLLPHEQIEVYTSGHLPHWRQVGSTYFVTFRTADSLPQSVLEKLAAERAAWLHRHGGDLANLTEDLREEFAKHFSAALEEKLDCGYGQCPLRDPVDAKTVADTLHHFDPERYRLGDYVIMPNHVHALITPTSGRSLEELLKSLKSFSAKEINRRHGTTGPFWQRDTYDHIVRTGDHLRKFQRYIENNPEKANLAPGKFLHRSARYTFG